MKKITLLFLVVFVTLTGFAQLKPASFSRNNERFVSKAVYQQDGALIGVQQPNVTASAKATLDESMGWSYYDLQTNSSTQPRIYKHPDGTIAGIFTMSHETSGYNDRGAGYRYYDGSAWGPQPTQRLEGNKAGWPNYAPLGPNGEIVVSHRGAVYPLYVNTREVKGSGTWNELILDGPAGASGLDWPRMVTNGPDNTYVHLIAVTGPEANGGTIWNGLDGAIVYNRSLDGGVTWDGWEQLDGMTSAEYLGFSGDSYAMAQPKGDTLAFVVGDCWYDFFLMKSTDNGETWEKTIIWPCPYNLWPGGDSLTAFYAPDGAVSIALDKYGMAHIAFGHMRASANAAGDKQWTINHDGLGYWNEYMEPLDPSMDPDTMYNHGQYIGWVQDTMVFEEETDRYAYYYLSMSSIPTIITDDYENVFVIWSSMTMNFDPNNYLLRHLFARASTDNGQTWRDTIVDLNSNVIYNWSECVYVSGSPTSDDKLYLLFQEDSDAGIFLKSDNAGYQGQLSATQNNYILLTPSKADIIVPGVGERETDPVGFELTQPWPNPASERSSMRLILDKAAEVQISVYSILGQQVSTLQNGRLLSGHHTISIPVSGLEQGVYFVSVVINNERQTRKLIVE